MYYYTHHLLKLQPLNFPSTRDCIAAYTASQPQTTSKNKMHIIMIVYKLVKRRDVLWQRLLPPHLEFFFWFLYIHGKLIHCQTVVIQFSIKTGQTDRTKLFLIIIRRIFLGVCDSSFCINILFNVAHYR